MICRNCGAELPDLAKFCTKCGSRQAAPSPAEPVREKLREAAEPA